MRTKWKWKSPVCCRKEKKIPKWLVTEEEGETNKRVRLTNQVMSECERDRLWKERFHSPWYLASSFFFPYRPLPDMAGKHACTLAQVPLPGKIPLTLSSQLRGRLAVPMAPHLWIHRQIWSHTHTYEHTHSHMCLRLRCQLSKVLFLSRSFCVFLFDARDGKT